MAGRQEGGGNGRRALREARLADKLRQNLVRRKAKTRALRDASRSGVRAGGFDTRTNGATADGPDECET